MPSTKNDDGFDFVPKEALEAYAELRDLHVQAARTDPADFASYVLRDEETAQPVSSLPQHREWQNLITANKNVLIWGHVESGKDLACDTLIPTPNGWERIEDLTPGRLVFSETGEPCMVMGRSEVFTSNPCFEVTFDDGASVIAGEGHLWKVASGAGPWVVLSTRQLLESDDAWHVPLNGCAHYVYQPLDLDPYFLGLWLACGRVTTPTLRVPGLDAEVLGRSAVGPKSIDSTHPTWVVDYDDDVKRSLKALGVLDRKALPTAYLTGCEEQRRRLMAGYLDGCGHSEDGWVTAPTENGVISAQFLELARSLGFKATSSANWDVTFFASRSPFRLRRKFYKPLQPTTSELNRAIVKIEPVDSVRTRCITVNSPDRTYLASRAYIPTHNTQQISIARTVWELGVNPQKRIVIVSNTDGQAQKICMSIGKYIERSAEVREVFPNLKRQKNAPWTQHSLTVEREGSPKDPSVQTCGVHGNVLGARIDMLVIDDILDYENSSSPKQREDLYNWVMSTLWGRLTRFAKVVCVGNPWHLDDIMHRWAKNSKAWMAVSYPLLNPKGESNWPERWPMSRIQRFKEEAGPIEYARQLLCVARSDETAYFKREYIEAGLERGRGRSLVYGLSHTPPGCSVYTGVDLSVGKEHSDLCVLFTILVHPDESREVLDISAGRWKGPEIVERIGDVYDRFGGIIVVENNGSQEFILQFTRKSTAIPVEPYTTTKNAFRDPKFGIESLAAEMANGKWIIPCDVNMQMEHEVSEWTRELLYYDPTAHAGDRLMASFFAREAARKEKVRLRTYQLDTLSR